MTISVSLATMKESHRVTYWVTLRNSETDQQLDKFSHNDGVITPSYFENLLHAQIETNVWCKFFGLPLQFEGIDLYSDTPAPMPNIVQVITNG